MARAKFHDYAIFEDPSDFSALKVVPNAQVTVYEPGSTSTPLAQTLYAGPTGGATKTNPFTAGADGSTEFWLDTPVFPSVKFDGTSAGLGVVTKHYLPTIAHPAEVIPPPDVPLSVDWYNVRDYGIVPAQDAPTRAANVLALRALAAMSFATGIPIYFPAGVYGFDPVQLNPTSGIPSISIFGDGWGTVLRFWGLTGPLLGLAVNGVAGLQHCVIKDLVIMAMEIMTSGAALMLGRCQWTRVQGVHVLPTSPTGAPHIAMQIGAPGLDCVVTWLLDSEFQNGKDHDNAPVIFCGGNAGVGELIIHNCTVRGAGTDGDPNLKSIGIQIASSVTFDGFKIVNNNIGTVKTGIQIAGVTVNNGIIANNLIDKIMDFAIQIGAAGTFGTQNIQIQNNWIVGEDIPIYLDGGASNGVAFINVSGNKIHGKCFDGAIVVISCVFVTITGNIIEAETNLSDPIVRVSGTSAHINITNNTIYDRDNVATYAIEVAAAVAPVLVMGNICIQAGINFLGATSPSRIYDAAFNSVS